MCKVVIAKDGSLSFVIAKVPPGFVIARNVFYDVAISMTTEGKGDAPPGSF